MFINWNHTYTLIERCGCGNIRNVPTCRPAAYQLQQTVMLDCNESVGSEPLEGLLTLDSRA